MNRFTTAFRILLALLLSIQFSIAESVELKDGTSFEAKVHSMENGYHTFEIPKSQIMQIKYANNKNDTDYISFVSNTSIATDIVKYVGGKYYIKIKNSEISALGNITKIDENYKFSSVTAAPTASKKSDYFLRLYGSNTIGAKLAPELIKAYLYKLGATEISSKQRAKEEEEITAMLKGKKVKVEIVSHGSSTGFKALNKNSCDIAMASRRVKDKEVIALQRFGNMRSDSNEHVIAIDGVAVFVNQENPIFKLDTTQIKDIYTGQLKNWSAIGGNNQKINLYARDKNSGTWDTFNKLILNKEALSPKAKRYEDNTELSNDVSKDIKGIGFGGLPYILNSKELAISDGETTVRPDRFTVATEDYPLSRRLFLYTSQNMSENLKAFIDFVLSSEGQDIVGEIGFVDLNVKNFLPILNDDMPKEYQKVVKGLSRLSVNFRFDSSSDSLDNKAKKDLDRLGTYFRENSISKRAIYLIGFSDSVGSGYSNMKLSKKRAETARKFLADKGIKIDAKNIKGFGEEYPVANNKTSRGRAKNRRVEIWVKK
ncbi:MAG: phosphate ABC transporter substrate-binding/OmpA family protein [Campylobacterota bacterium]|nr:phosphate ABC transporter substrate-binding/OmpA family protein [Campylobacterota bacterium]